MSGKIKANQIWAEHIRQHSSPRMTDDQAEQAFWREFIAKKRSYLPESSALRVLEWLLPLLRAFGVETALELGPGWGNYTIELARFCRRVDCVDISQDVLDFVLRIAKEQGCHNVRGIHKKWEDFSPRRSYDLVFGYNCFYRQADLADCFARMDRAAGKLCAAGMNTAEVPAWCRELETAGGVLNWDWKNCGYFYEILRQMGLQPEVASFSFKKECVYLDTEALVNGECAHFVPGSLPAEAAQDVLCRHFTRASDGAWHGTLECRSSVVWWRKRH